VARPGWVGCDSSPALELKYLPFTDQGESSARDANRDNASSTDAHLPATFIQIYMGTKTANTNLRMPIFGGGEFTRGGEARTLLKGVYVVDGRLADKVQQLFMDSARYTYYEPPEKLIMTAGEIFYQDGKIAEVRLRGDLPLIRDKEWADFDLLEDEEVVEILRRENERWPDLPLINNEERVWKLPSWTTDDGPDFSWVDDLRLAFSPRDLGRPYVAALKIGGPLLLWWNVESAHTDNSPPDTDVRRIRIARPAEITQGSDDKTAFDAAIRYTSALARSADVMMSFLTRLRDDSLLDFIDERWPFGYAFGRLLKQQINHGDPSSGGRLSFSMKKMSKAEMRAELLTAIAEMAREHLSISRGRRDGSKTKIRNPDTEAKKEAQRLEKKVQLKENILLAMVEEYNHLRKKSPAETEFKVTPGAITTRLKTKRRTFYNWLKRVGSSFEELETEAFRRALHKNSK
jgi:hypothetical protein